MDHSEQRTPTPSIHQLQKSTICRQDGLSNIDTYWSVVLSIDILTPTNGQQSQTLKE